MLEPPVTRPRQKGDDWPLIGGRIPLHRLAVEERTLRTERRVRRAEAEQREARHRIATGEPSGQDWRFAHATAGHVCAPWHDDQLGLVPADACRVLGRLPRAPEGLLHRAYLALEAAASHGWRVMLDGVVWRSNWTTVRRWVATIDGEEHHATTSALGRALHHAPLPDWLARALYLRCPRDDQQPWRLTDVLTHEQLALLEGGTRKPDWPLRTMDDRWDFDDGQGIPFDSERNGDARFPLIQIGVYQAGRMIGQLERVCTFCRGRNTVRCDPCGERRVVPLIPYDHIGRVP